MLAGGRRILGTAKTVPATTAVLALLALFAVGVLAPDPVEAQGAKSGDEFLIVDCLLPGKIRKLGRNVTFLTPRRPVRTTQSDCEIRGGEYTSYDRADYGTALKIWLPLAQEGDPKAQSYVGELAEKGLGQTADYEMAALWYRRAAEQGYAPAQINLGQLYEKGLGVKKDMATAVMWYRRASGLNDANIQNVSFGDAAAAGEIERLQSALSERTEEVNALRAELSTLNQDLAKARVDRQKVDSAVATDRRDLDRERQDLARDREALAAERAELAKTQDQAEKSSSAEARQVQAAADKLAREKASLAAQAKELAEREAELAGKQQVFEQEQRDASKAESAERKSRAQDLADQEAALKQQAADLAAREAAAERERQAFEAQQKQADKAAAAELDKRTKELAERQRQLDEREQKFAKQQKDLDALNAQIAKLDAEIEKRRSVVASLEQPAAADAGGSTAGAAGTAPRIQVIEPPLIRSRGEGMPVVLTRAGTQFRTIVGKVIAPLGLYQVLVNDHQVKVDENAMFQAEVPVELGPTPVTIVALDKTGQRADVAFELRPESQTAAKAADGKAKPTPGGIPNVSLGQFHALIIGNYDYQHLPKLETPRADATALAELLKKKYGFETTVLLNATRYDILSALNKLRATLTKNDNLLVYYAGHGELDKVNNRGNWLPVDAEPDSTANWIANTAITDILNAMSARKVMVIADSCYSGSLTRSVLARLDAGRTPEAQEAWLKLMASKRSRMAFTSGGLAPVLDGGGGRHSIFAKALLDALRSNAGLIDGESLHRIVAQSVSFAAGGANFEQLPQYAPIQFAGHEAGDFFFVPSS